jgi:hypothetical protein
MEVILKLPDSVYNDDPIGYSKFMRALQQMLDRMAMSHFKYQHKHVPPTMEAAVEPIDELNSAYKRIAMYSIHGCAVSVRDELFTSGKDEDTGNTENLLDAANMLVIEHCYPKHPKAHFRSQGLHESPGLEYIP